LGQNPRDFAIGLKKRVFAKCISRPFLELQNAEFLHRTRKKSL
jgi:hypothetical protein